MSVATNHAMTTILGVRSSCDDTFLPFLAFPSIPFYFVLCPIIIDQADRVTRSQCLINVNQDLRKLYHAHGRSDRAKSWHGSSSRILIPVARSRIRSSPPQISEGVEWMVWSGKNSGFRISIRFAHFVRSERSILNGISNPRGREGENESRRSLPLLCSRTIATVGVCAAQTSYLTSTKILSRDILVIHHCHYIGVMGLAGLVIAMYSIALCMTTVRARTG